MSSANRIAIVILSILVSVGLTSCGRNSPTAPTPGPSAEGPLTPGVYRLNVLSVGSTYGCSSGNQTIIGQSGGVTFEVQLDGAGREWTGRLRTPAKGDLQLTLRIRDDDRAVTGTMRGRGVDDSTLVGVLQGSLEVSQPATMEASLTPGPPLLMLGKVDGGVVYDRPSTGPVACTSATWTLDRGALP
jgi:hypothetical protein